MGFEWKKLIGTLAPMLGLALGGPGKAAATALTVVSRALLGHEDGTEDDVAAVLAAGASPEQVERLRSAERDYALKLVDASIALEKIEADDRANARAKEVATHDKMPAILALILTIGVFCMLAVLVFVPLPASNQRAFDMMLGTVGTAWIGAMSYYHGSSAGSRSKDIVNAKLSATKRA